MHKLDKFVTHCKQSDDGSVGNASDFGSENMDIVDTIDIYQSTIRNAIVAAYDPTIVLFELGGYSTKSIVRNFFISNKIELVSFTAEMLAHVL